MRVNQAKLEQKLIASDKTSALDQDLPDEPGEATSGPVRTCAVTREERPVGDLVRFVAGPDGVIVPDLARRLPGRGVWVELSRERIGEAVRRNVFAKSLKRPVSAAADLPDRVDALLLKRALEALALANKAALIVPGFAQIEEALESNAFAGLCHGRDAAPGGCEKLDRKFRAIAAAHQIQPQIINQLTIDQMSLAIGRPNVVHAGLISGGATTRLLDEVDRLKRFRASPGAARDGVAGPEITRV